MDDKLRQQLQHPDARQRGLALREILNSGDRAFIPLLQQVYRQDSDARVRQMALNVARKLAALSSPPVGAQPAPQRPSSSGLPDLDRIEAAKQARSRRRSGGISPYFVVFTLAVIAVGAFVVYDRYRQLNSPLQQLLRGVIDAEPLPAAGDAPYAGALDGHIYYARLNNQTDYYLAEPSGQMPEHGWPLLLGVHGSGGSGRDMLPIAAKTQQAGVMLVTPGFTSVSSGSDLYDGDYMARDIQGIVSQVDARYDLDHNATVLYGFSMGGAVTAGFVARFPGYFDGAGVFGAPAFEMPPASTAVRYVVVTGALDEREGAARHFVQDMADQGLPVWYHDIQPGVGHTMTAHMEDKVLELALSFR